MRDTYNALTTEQRRAVCGALQHRRAAHTMRLGGGFDYVTHEWVPQRPRSTHHEADEAQRAAEEATGLSGEELSALLDHLAGYYALRDTDDTYPDLTDDTPRRCELCGGRIVPPDDCGPCARRHAESRQHVKRMRRIVTRVENEGLGATPGTRNAVSVDGLALDVLLDEVDLHRENAASLDDALAEAEEARRSA